MFFNRFYCVVKRGRGVTGRRDDEGRYIFYEFDGMFEY